MILALAIPVAGLLMAFAGAAGAVGVTVAVIVAVLLLAVVWPLAIITPDGRSTTVLVTVAGLAGVAVELTEQGLADGRPEVLGTLAPVLGVVFVGAAVLQLLRRDGRAGLTTSLASSVTAGVIAVLGAAWIPLAQVPSASTGLVAAALGVGAAGVVLLLARTVSLPHWATSVTSLVALAAAALAGLGVTAFDKGDVVTAPEGAAIAAAAAVAAVLVEAMFQAVRAEGEDWTEAPVQVEVDEDAPLPVTRVVRLRRRATRPDPDMVGLAMGVSAVLLAALPAYVVSRIFVG